MGTTTFFLRHNDLAKPLSKMNKKELEKIDSFSAYGPEQHHAGWSVPLELHNGNIYALVFWKGRLMKLEEAPEVLNEKYYDKYKGKNLKEYEWTILKRHLSAEIEYLDRKFKKARRISKTKKDK